MDRRKFSVSEEKYIELFFLDSIELMDLIIACLEMRAGKYGYDMVEDADELAECLHKYPRDWITEIIENRREWLSEQNFDD